MIKDFAFLADVTVKIVVSISSVAFGLGMAVSGYMAEQQAKNAEQDRQIEELKKKFYAPSEQIAFYERQYENCHENLNKSNKAANTLYVNYMNCRDREKNSTEF